MKVLIKFRHERCTSFILITHDVATSSEIADRVALMYAGQLGEVSTAQEFFHQPDRAPCSACICQRRVMWCLKASQWPPFMSVRQLLA